MRAPMAHRQTDPGRHDPPMHAAGPRRERWMASAAGLVGLVVIVTGVVMSGPPAPDPGTGSGAIAAGHHESDPASAPPATVAPATDPGSPSASGASMAPPSTSPPPPDTGPFPGGVLVADRGNHRILVLDDRGRIVWRFPERGSLPAGWASVSADDAFLAPDGRSIVANDESHETIVRIDLTSRRVVWTYGRYGRPGGATGLLHTPDDAYPLANGDIVVADIENCRILEIAPSHRIVHQWGRTGVCVDDPPRSFARPNGDTPLPDGGLLVTEITGSRVVRLAADGHVVFDIHVPVAYPSDAQLDAAGNVVVADYSTIGQVVAVNPATGRLVWRWRFTGGIRRLDHPSLATPLANGDVSVNDDFRQRVIVIDPRTMRIVWQFGRTDHAGAGGFSLDVPDGHQPLPAIGPF